MLQHIDALETAGRVWLRRAIPQRSINTLAQICDVGSLPGARLDATAQLLSAIDTSRTLIDLIRSIGLDNQPTRLVAFNKSSASNWSVPWHQDRVIAVQDRVDVAGYKSWVSKPGFYHCEPPSQMFEHMVFARIHLDDTHEENGALQIALGSHKHGVVSAQHAASVAAQSPIEVCTAEPGDVLVLKALVLHRSSSAKVNKERRAIRLDYARRSDLPAPLTWALP